MKWLDSLDTEHHTPPQNFQGVSLWFRSGTRFSPHEAVAFREEFYRLISYVDGAWEREMAGTPQKIWNDFSKYPTLGQHIHLIRFQHSMPFKPQRWAVATPKGGAYDPAGPRWLSWSESRKGKTSRIIQA